MKTFDHLLLLGRPAAGKSEFIDFMKKTSDAERAEKFHIGRFEEIDDFPWLWEKFLEDDMWEKAGYPRMYSRHHEGNYNVTPEKGELYDFLFAKFNYEIRKNYLSRPEYYDDGTLIIEFSRGCESGYDNALRRLSKDVLENAAILYVLVDFEESWRRNVARYNEKLKHSSLAHMAPRETMERFYKTDDWAEVTGGRDSGTINYHGIDIPFVTMNNTPELKERGALEERYTPHLNRLAKLYHQGR